MWIMLNKSFLSIVEPEQASTKGARSQKLLVRARLPGDIEAVFPDATVRKTPERDYLYRALIERIDVAEAIAEHIAQIDYHNFKGSTHDNVRHDAYMDVWSAMNRVQENRKPVRRAIRNHNTGIYDY